MLYYLFAVTVEGSFTGASAYVMFLLTTFVLILASLSPALVLLSLAKRKAEAYKNKRINLSIPQYEPPKQLSPAQIGLLYDMDTDIKEVIATLFDLEQRNVLKINNQKTVEITDTSKYEKLELYEKIAVGIFTGITDRSTIGSENLFGLAKTEENIQFWTSEKTRFRLAVQKSLMDKDIRLKSYRKAFALRVALMTFLLSLSPLLLAFSGIEVNGEIHGPLSFEAVKLALVSVVLFGMILFPAYITTSIICVWGWTKIAGKYWLNSKEARALWPEIEGYRRYLELVEIDNIQFESSSHAKSINQALPYAIALCLETKWQKLLKNRTTG